MFNFGALAQLGERLNGIQEVRGSNPLSSTSKLHPTPRGGIFFGENFAGIIVFPAHLKDQNHLMHMCFIFKACKMPDGSAIVSASN